MKGYKIMRNGIYGPMYLCDDNKTFNDTGFIWKKRTSAEKVLSCFQQKRWNLSVVEIDVEDIRSKLSGNESELDSIFQKTLPEDIFNAIKTASASIDSLDAYQQYLNECLSLEDKTASDLLHFIELSDEEDNSKKIEVYNLLKRARKNRREIKDKLKIVMAVKIDMINGDTSSIDKCITAIDERYYSPKTNVLDKFQVNLK